MLDLGDQELERLHQLLLLPRRYVERRVETVEFTAADALRSLTRLQIRVPRLDGEGESGDAATRYIAIGMYPRRSLPDLRVWVPGGQDCAIVSSPERGRALGSLLAERIVSRVTSSAEFLAELDPAGELAVAEAKESATWILKYELTELSVAKERKAAAAASSVLTSVTNVRDELATKLSEDPDSTNAADPILKRILDAMLADGSFLREVVKTLEVTTYLVVRHSAKVGERVLLNVSHTDATIMVDNQPQKAREVGGVDSMTLIAKMVFSRALSLLGAGPLTIERRCQNSDHCQSYYFSVIVPEGTVVDRLHWSECADDAERRHQRSVPDDFPPQSECQSRSAGARCR